MPPIKFLKLWGPQIGFSFVLIIMTICFWSYFWQSKTLNNIELEKIDDLDDLELEEQLEPGDPILSKISSRLIHPSVRKQLDLATPTKAIPKIILQTHIDKTLIPFEVYHNIKNFAPEYNHVILNDEEALDFLEHYFHPLVKQRFLKFSNGAHKADILRYALLYVYGGVYLDIKTELIRPLDDLISKEDTIYTVISSVPNSIYQGIIATPPQKPIFLDLIAFMIQSENPSPETYLKFTNDFYFRVKRDVMEGSKTNLAEGLNLGSQNQYFLFQEICSSNATDCYDGLDRYGVCCFATLNGERVIKIRRSSYPWFKNRLGKKLVGPLIFHDNS